MMNTDNCDLKDTIFSSHTSIMENKLDLCKDLQETTREQEPMWFQSN